MMVEVVDAERSEIVLPDVRKVQTEKELRGRQDAVGCV